jgi:hypothetical protein
LGIEAEEGFVFEPAESRRRIRRIMNAPALTATCFGVAGIPSDGRGDGTLLILGVLVGGLLGAAVTFLMMSLRPLFGRRQGSRGALPPQATSASRRSRPVRSLVLPCRWLAIRATQPKLVQTALGLHHPIHCSWEDGLTFAHEHKLFISPCVNGWVLVMGAPLPDPADDVDRCFVFLLNLSRKLGHVQFFSFNRGSHHHAWAYAENGRIRRAYAWAGRTHWNQGRMTSSEVELGLTCYDYGAPARRVTCVLPDPLVTNTERVPALAAHWSLDPGTVDPRILRQTQGIAGELSESRIH